MKRDRRIASSNLPVASPGRVIWIGAVVWLLLDRFRAPEWATGVAFTLLGLCLVASIAARFLEEPVDLLGKKDEEHD